MCVFMYVCLCLCVSVCLCVCVCVSVCVCAWGWGLWMTRPRAPRQVEINTIAVGYSAASEITVDMHRCAACGASGGWGRCVGACVCVWGGGEAPNDAVCRYLTARFSRDVGALRAVNMSPGSAPENRGCQNIVAAVVAAHTAYGVPGCVSGATWPTALGTDVRRSAVVVFVVQEGERDNLDQRRLIYTMWATARIPVYRLTMREASVTRGWRCRARAWATIAGYLLLCADS